MCIRDRDFTGADSRRFVDIGQKVRQGTTLADLLATVESQALTEALTQTDGDRQAAASLLGITTKQFQDRHAKAQ